jgi:nucleoside phosphorylase
VSSDAGKSQPEFVQVAFWDVKSGAELGSVSLEGQGGGFNPAAISPDGCLLAVTNFRDNQNRLVLIDVPQRKLIKTIELTRNAADLGDNSIARTPIFSPDGKWIAATTQVFPGAIDRDDDVSEEDVPQPLIHLVDASAGTLRDGASQYYKSDGMTVTATMSPDKLQLLQSADVPCHAGRIYTTAALFAEGKREIDEWHARGYAAVDMETAATFAVAEHFGMDRVSILFAFDNPRHSGHLLLDEADKMERRARGNRRMNEVAFELIRMSFTG